MSSVYVYKFKMKSDLKVHIKAKPEQQRGMICFNVDLKIKFYFEFGNTRMTIPNTIL